MINLNPIQTGGILTKAAKRALIEFGDGYSVYDISPGLELEEMPAIREFVSELLPKFLGADIVRLTLGAREAMFSVMHSVAKPGDAVIVDGNRHYTTVTAAERAGLKVIEVRSSGEPEYKIDVNDYEDLIKRHNPRLILLTYPDGNYGNLPDAKTLGQIAKKYNIPFFLSS